MALFSLILFVFATAGTPGPNNTIAMASGASFGLRRTLPIIGGVNLGFPLLIVLIGVGLRQALARWPVILDVLRPAGVLYLLYADLQRRDGHAARRLADPRPHRDLALAERVARRRAVVLGCEAARSRRDRIGKMRPRPEMRGLAGPCSSACRPGQDPVLARNPRCRYLGIVWSAP